MCGRNPRVFFFLYDPHKPSSEPIDLRVVFYL